MLVDGFTTVAQIINFLILVWLLRRFLYKPVLRAMDKREEQMIRARKDADEQRIRAENEKLTFEKKLQELTGERERLLRSAAEQAAEERKKLISAAREEVSELEARWRAALDHERTTLLQEFSTRIEAEIFAISRKVLSDLAGANLEPCIAERFAERLRSLEPGEIDQLAGSPENTSMPVVVASAFELPENSRRQLEEGVRQKLGVREIQFATAPDLIGGIELRTNGHKLSWTIRNYLSSLQEEMEQMKARQEVEDVKPAS